MRYRNEKDMILEQMWGIVLRETKVDDAGCDWFTSDNCTFIRDAEWMISDDKEIANLVNAINALKGYLDLINKEILMNY